MEQIVQPFLHVIFSPHHRDTEDFDIAADAGKLTASVPVTVSPLKLVCNPKPAWRRFQSQHDLSAPTNRRE